ncbi:MAG: ATP-binding protein [Eubacteriales bacterium]|nr:ATP-binding protein [Eubacteriales bacterium]
MDADGNIIGVIESCQNLEDLEPQIYNFLSNYSQVLSLHLFSADEGLVLTSVEKSGANAHYERGTYHDLESIAERLVDGGILEDFGDNSIVYYSGIDRANVGSAYILMVEFDENYYTNSTFLVNAKIDKLFGIMTVQIIISIIVCLIIILAIIVTYIVNLNRVIINAMEQLSEQTKIAEQANLTKSHFLATMSHEIRTPLNAIIGISDIALQSGTLSPESLERVIKIHSSANGLLGIINDILDLSKIERGNLELNPADYDVPSLINDAVQLNIARIGSKPIEFTLNVSENLPSKLFGDELRLKQILSNILSNAFKYTDAGSVKLSVAHEQNGENITLIFTVSDTGQGMKPEDLERLFSEYSRFNAEANRNTEGTGLGMSITRKLVTLMNGTIEVESEYGKGSMFTVKVQQGYVDCGVIGAELAEKLFNFTFSHDKQAAKLQIIRKAMPYGSVLIVDDVDTNLYVAEGLLSPYGLKIETAGSGFEALDKVQSGKVYDIIFMDHMMPKMDGIETTQKLRQLGYEAPIVALTANAISGNDKMFKANSFDDFISKPIDIRHLNTVLNTYIRDRHKDDAAKYKDETAGSAAEVPAADPKMMQIFKRDAVKALVTLRESTDSGDWKLFTTTAHAMKSALANINEPQLSDKARALESAGREEDTAFISANLAAFLKGLEQIVSSIAVPQSDYATDDTDFLRSQLTQIAEACENYDSRAAKTGLAALEARQ